MNHESAVHLIADLLHGRLNDDIKSEMLAHVLSCEECKALSETHITLSEACGGADLDDHPSSSAIVRFALKKDEMAPGSRDQVASHVLSCRTCASEVETTIQAEAQATEGQSFLEERSSSSPSPVSRSYWRAAAAAGIVLAILGYPAAVGLFETPRLERRLALLEAERGRTEGAQSPATELWTGPVDVVVLQGPTRAATPRVPTIVITKKQPYATIAVNVSTREELRDAESVLFRIQAADGAVTWSWELTPEELRGGTGAFIFLVPSSSLPAGNLSLIVLRDSGEGEPLLDAPFIVERLP